jgi:threonine dehydratase
MSEPTLKEIREASHRIRPFIHCTPVLTCSTINRMCEAELFFKCENFQKVGAFKIRGATNAVFILRNQEAAKGVATHSSGNAPHIKRAAVANYGAEIILCQPTLKAREERLAEVVDHTGAVFIHPYNDYRVIAGQGTAALELCKEIPNLDIVITPVGGGGLLSGTAITVSAISPKIHVIAAEPERADDAYRSFHAGRIIHSVDPDTIADGLLTSLGSLTFPIIKHYVKDIVTVTEEGIVHAMRTIWERMKIIVEPSAAVPLAAILTNRIPASGKRIGIILSGGNVDLANLPWND